MSSKILSVTLETNVLEISGHKKTHCADQLVVVNHIQVNLTSNNVMIASLVVRHLVVSMLSCRM